MSQNMRPKGARQLAHHYYLVDRLRQIEWDLHRPIAQRRAIPPAWEEIAKRTRRSKKQRVTMWIEGDVVKFFKSLGAGYQTKMNEVLASFMDAKLSGILGEAESIKEYFDWAGMGKRPELGEAGAEMAEIRAARERRERGQGGPE